MLTTRPRGTNDFLPNQVEKWQFIENQVRQLCAKWGYREIRTPIFEHTELFLRSVGETTDIVEKEMYSFEDKGFRHMTLRPEGTAGTVRAFLENKLYAQPQPTKLYYMGPMFRYDQPQAGRYRQFHQFGIEVFGVSDASIDAEVIALATTFFKTLGLNALTTKINTVGCSNCRPAHQEALRQYFSAHKAELCPTCLGRLAKNPLRILDCKNESCRKAAQNAPTTIEAACDDCRNHFEQLKSYLDGMNITYQVDTNLVRGLDYYTRTAFEVVINSVGSAQNAICGGGRYNSLLAQCGGEDMPGIGMAIGLERLLLTLEEQQIDLNFEVYPQVYIASLGEAAKKESFLLAMDLRNQGIYTEIDYLDRSLKAQMKGADRMQVKFTVIIGEEEIDKRQVQVREMSTSEQITVSIDELTHFLKERL